MKLYSVRKGLLYCAGCMFLIFAFLTACTSGDKSQPQSGKIIKAEYTELKVTENGRLEITGSGEDQIYVLTLWGTPYQMGKAHGTLLKDEIFEQVKMLIRLMTEKMEQPPDILDDIFKQAQPFIPTYFIEEMRGIADGSGLELQDIIRANLIGEASEFHCSLFGAWGKATAADSHLYQLRCLDYETHANIQKYPVMVVYVPEQGHAFANITWAGVVGCISGISQARLAISEIGDDYDAPNDTFAGIPFMFLLRDVLQFDKSLDDAISRIQNAPRTTSLMYGVGDGEMGQLRGFQTSHTLCNVFDPDNLEPLTDAHKRIEDVVYWGMSWNVPRYDGPLHDKLVEYYGKINAENTINDIITSVGTGNLQTVVYDLTAMKIWIANARADHESGPLEAYNRQFVEFDMNALFKKASESAGN
ncbi:hypothetical protein JXJ21_17765 [candidate division KSB1 bacterium]|nr:hypothetical protein [candidate division KSB1 bacterium]